MEAEISQYHRATLTGRSKNKTQSFLRLTSPSPRRRNIIEKSKCVSEYTAKDKADIAWRYMRFKNDRFDWINMGKNLTSIILLQKGNRIIQINTLVWANFKFLVRKIIVSSKIR